MNPPSLFFSCVKAKHITHMYMDVSINLRKSIYSVYSQGLTLTLCNPPASNLPVLVLLA